MPHGYNGAMTNPKTTETGPKPVTIVADSREARSGIASRLAKIPGVTLEQAELSSGDYLIGNGIAVECDDCFPGNGQSGLGDGCTGTRVAKPVQPYKGT